MEYFSLQLCASVQMPDCFGGIEGHAVYIDTYNGFTPHRLLGINYIFKKIYMFNKKNCRYCKRVY